MHVKIGFKTYCILLLSALIGPMQVTYTQIPIIRSVTHKIPPYNDYWSYNDQNRPISIISTTRDSSTVIMFYNFIRNQDQLLLKTDVKDVSYTIIYSFNYYYNNANQVVRIEKLSDMDYDGKADDLDHEFSIGYDSLGRVSKMKIKKGYTIARDFNFTWKDGNIIRVDNEDGELNYHLELEYDAIPNPLEPIKWEYITTTGTLEFYMAMFCRNNIVKATLYPAAMEKDELEINTEYDENGFFKTNHFEGVEFHYQ